MRQLFLVLLISVAVDQRLVSGLPTPVQNINLTEIVDMQADSSPNSGVTSTKLPPITIVLPENTPNHIEEETDEEDLAVEDVGRAEEKEGPQEKSLLEELKNDAGIDKDGLMLPKKMGRPEEEGDEVDPNGEDLDKSSWYGGFGWGGFGGWGGPWGGPWGGFGGWGGPWGGFGGWGGPWGGFGGPWG